MTVHGVMRLSCVPNSYHWGKVGKNSKVAEYASADPAFVVDDSKHYSELWMGTHPSGMSVSFDDRELTLGKFIASNPKAILGERVSKMYDNQLPFLYKILSIQTALSIQAHPGKKLAKKLHKILPELYRDPNHKPEMAIAISEFEALSGFRPLSEIISFLSKIPELYDLLGPEVCQKFIDTASNDAATVQENRASLKAIFSELMKKDPETVKDYLSALIERTKGSLSSTADPALQTVHRLNSEYPNDIGVFCVFFLNLIRLHPGEGFFMGANEPHAYLRGECVECMATSDNVVRAGLTPKFRDVDTLVNMIHYFYGPAEEKLFSPKPWKNNESASVAKYTTLYDPNIEEFSMLKSSLPSNASEDLVIDGPSILIVTEGSGSLTSQSKAFELKAGYAYFISSSVPFTFTTNATEKITIYTAFCDGA